MRALWSYWIVAVSARIGVTSNTAPSKGVSDACREGGAPPIAKRPIGDNRTKPIVDGATVGPSVSSDATKDSKACRAQMLRAEQRGDGYLHERKGHYISAGQHQTTSGTRR
jgi:hypothetical protein